MPERIRQQPYRKPRRFAAEGLTAQKVLGAILLGAVLGLLTSVVRVAVKSRSRTLVELDDNPTTTGWQTSQQANLLSDEKHRRELAEQSNRQTLHQITQLKNDLQQAEAVARGAQLDKESAFEEATQAQARLAQLSSTVQQLVQRNEQASKEAQAAKQAAHDATQQAHKATTRVKFGLSSKDDRHALIRPNSQRDASDPKLAGLLRKVAIDSEIILGICSKDATQPVQLINMWASAIQHSQITNAVIAAMDADCIRSAEKLRMPAFKPAMQEGQYTRDQQKFEIVRQVMQLGYAVLMTDMDVVILSNPFRHLSRDADLEVATDGLSNVTAYGQVWKDTKLGSANEALIAQLTVLNPGLFYVRPTRASLDFLDAVSSRLSARPSANPKLIFNEAILMPSSAQYKSPRVHVRVLDYMDFMNSGMLFNHIRGNPLLEAHTPVMVHLSYHSDKLPRMQVIVDRYINNNMKALDEVT